MIQTIINIGISLSYVIMLSLIYISCFKDRTNNWYRINILKRRVTQFVLIFLVVNSFKLIRHDIRQLLLDNHEYNGFHLTERFCFSVVLFILIRIKIEFKNFK